ncbi:RNA polymerase sigma-70 factor [Chitinophaga horti]|uniref:RNA polymerase sigma-70 factor n=1 Tax=Chitinophaga horti TaxID=2920382 RepID=A0ABY6IW07_9BACT|nr:RNA polymerase sigma-70 factor [Chitinophaga horti]UYQ91423.1 RNA polymerase sigma-70 factor [Chitinophaga horti]
MALKPLSDEAELLAMIAAGDQRAFTKMFNHYQRDLYLFSKSVTKSEEAAVEVVQDVFLKIWSARTELSSIDNFPAFLNRIVRNHSLNVLRKIGRENRLRYPLKADQTGLENVLPDQTTHQELDYNDAVRLLNTVLAELPTQQRLVYQLCHVEGLKYEEAALKLGISVETVRVHMKRAIRKIRIQFANHAILYPLLIIALAR